MRSWGLFFFILFLLLIISAICWFIFTQFRARRSGLPAPTWQSYIPFLRSSGSSSSAFANLPTPRSRNLLEWIKDKVNSLRRGQNRTAQGHYEESGAAYGGAGVGLSSYGAAPTGSSSSSSRRAPGMGPDEAWDTRVGNEADAYGASGGPGGYYEEQELGLAPVTRVVDPYGSDRGGATLPAYGDGVDARGRSKSRDLPGVTGGLQGLDTRYEREMSGSGSQQQQPQRSGLAGDTNNPFSDAHEAGSLRGVSPRPVLGPTAASAQAGKAKGGGGDGAVAQDDGSPTERKSMFRESL